MSDNDTGPLRTSIVDSHPLVRLGLTEALGRDPYFDVVAAREKADVVLVSGNLPADELTAEVERAVSSSRHVVVYNGPMSNATLVSDVLLAGCSAVLSSQTTIGATARATRNLLSAHYAPIGDHPVLPRPAANCN